MSYLQVINKPVDDLTGPDPVGDLHCGVDELPVVAPVQGHAVVPEVLEEVGEDLLLDVLRLHAVGGAALLDHLQHDLLHLLVRRLELSDEDEHHLPGVVVGVLSVHEGDEVADGLEEGGQALAAVGTDALPQGLEHGVEGLDAVRGGGLGQGGQGQGRDGAHLLLLVHQAVLDDLHQRTQVG